MRILQFFCASLLVLNLTSCRTKPDPVEKAAISPANSVTATAPVSAKSSPGFAALQAVVTATTTAIEAGKLDAAKTEFAKFESSWKTVEDGIKSKSPTTYRAIEDGVKSIDKGIDSKQSKAILLSSLQKLSLTIEQASK
jgi:hypothetical protein